MWLTFKDTDELKALVVKDILATSKDFLAQMPIYCDQLADYGRYCNKGDCRLPWTGAGD